MLGPGVGTKEAPGEGAEAGGWGYFQSVWCPMVKSGRTGHLPLYVCMAPTEN